jgi:histone demethylase JARID1
LDDVFADLTNQEEVEPESEPMENLHATEALEALNASNGSSRAPSPNDDAAPNGEAQTTTAAAAETNEDQTKEDPESEL